jgi:putrescine transport system permease protein
MGRFARRVVIGLPFAWMALFFLLPLLIVLKIGFAHSAIGIPPYTPLVGPGGVRATLKNFARLGRDDLYLHACLGSLSYAGVATLCCLALGYPLAYAIARMPGARRQVFLFAVMLPFWTSFLLLNNAFSVELGLVYSYLPFMVLPLYGNLAAQDESLVEAAADLGASPWRAFLAVTLPLSWPGIAAGALLVLIPAVGEFVIPALLGGPGTLMIGKVLWDEFFLNHDWPAAAAVAIALVAALTGPLLVAQRLLERERRP